MARIASFLGGAVATLAALAVGPTMGQRIHFPTAIPTNTASSVAQYPTPGYPSAPALAPVNPTAPRAAPSYAPGVSPAYPSPTTPSYTPGVTPAYPPGVAPSYALPGPTATFQGNIQPPATWDPYATPGLQAPGLLPQDPCLPPAPAFVYPAPSGTIQTMKKFLREVNLGYIWMPGNGPRELGIHDVDLSASFAIPFLYNPDRPLLVTPGFAIHFWNGPTNGLFPPNPPPRHFPTRTYDAYVDGAWNPQMTQILGAELAVRVGVYSDFTKLTNQSVRYQGKGLVVFSFSPGVQVKAGVMYLDRERIKLFPTGGLVWSPNPDLRFELLFPNPKLAARLKSYGNTEWWAYFRGEYGGGSWTIKGINDGVTDETGVVRPRDYNDTRAAVGLEFDSLSGMDGLFEVGIAFEREIYGNGGTLFAPNSTVFVGGGLSY